MALQRESGWTSVTLGLTFLAALVLPGIPGSEGEARFWLRGSRMQDSSQASSLTGGDQGSKSPLNLNCSTANLTDPSYSNMQQLNCILFLNANYPAARGLCVQLNCSDLPSETQCPNPTNIAQGDTGMRQNNPMPTPCGWNISPSCGSPNAIYPNASWGFGFIYPNNGGPQSVSIQDFAPATDVSCGFP